jgi:hypothetical protein
LDVRKGIAKQFGIQATGNYKIDASVRQQLRVYEPYLSIVTFYIWRIADTPDVINATALPTKPSSLPNQHQKKQDHRVQELSTPTTTQKRRKISRQVTP